MLASAKMTSMFALPNKANSFKEPVIVCADIANEKVHRITAKANLIM